MRHVVELRLGSAFSMKSRFVFRVCRAAALATLAAVVLITRVFVDVDLVRVPVISTSRPAASGVVRSTATGQSRANALQTPFAVTLRISRASSEVGSYSVVVDGERICTRDVAGDRSRRVDCAVVTGWHSAGDHEIVVQGPASAWTIDSLELSTHHGRNGTPYEFLILPGGSDHYLHPAPIGVVAMWLLLTMAIAFLPEPPAMPRSVAIAYRLVAGLALMELAVTEISPWVSSYRIVLSTRTFASLLIVLFLPRLWSTAREVVKWLRPRPAWSAGLAVVAIAAMTLAGGARYRSYRARARLLAELRPAALKNCEFKRFGEAADGGYILCANLLGSVQSAYSYGISGYDQWGCDVSRQLSVTVHEYDCFDLRAPSCPGGRAIFHPECVGSQTATIEGRLFDSPERQFEKNGDGRRRLVVKMDVESAEWDTLAHASDAVLERIDQLAIELHGVVEPDRNLVVIRRLKQFFYVASLHFNNASCQENIAPFPAWAYEVLFVNKRIGIPGGSGPAGAPSSQLAANDPHRSDCQSTADLPQVAK